MEACFHVRIKKKKVIATFYLTILTYILKIATLHLAILTFYLRNAWYKGAIARNKRAILIFSKFS